MKKNKHTLFERGTPVTFTREDGTEVDCIVLGYGRDRGRLTVYYVEFQTEAKDGSLIKIKYHVREHELKIRG